MPTPHFDAASHTYRTPDGRKLPSVTQVLVSAGIIDTQWFSEQAAWRGTVVHRCCELDDRGRLKDDSVDPGARGYLEAWRAFKSQHDIVITAVEEPRFHESFLYAGTPDVVGFFRDEPVIIDRKTGPAAKWHALQLAAYTNLHLKPLLFRRYTVRLQPDGRFVMTEYTRNTLLSDWACFHSALNVHNWRNTHGC